MSKHTLALLAVLGVAGCGEAGPWSSGHRPGPPSTASATVSDAAQPFTAQGGFNVREHDGQPYFEVSVSGGHRDATSGEPAPLSFQTPLSLDEVRLLMGGGAVIRPDPPTAGAVTYFLPGGRDPQHGTVSRWMRRIELVWNDDATLTLRATLGPVFRFEDGAARPSAPTAVAEVHGTLRVACTIVGTDPNGITYDPHFESAFCRTALADTGLSRVVALAE